MFLSGHAAKVLGILVAYSVAAGAGTALALARSSRAGIERLMATARRFGGGDLSARVGRLDAEPELRTLAATLDDMAAQISRSIEHERFVETMRRDLFNAVSHDLRTPLTRLRGDQQIQPIDGMGRRSAEIDIQAPQFASCGEIEHAQMVRGPAHEYRFGDDVVRLQRAEESLRCLRRRITFQYVAIELIDANREEQRHVPGDVDPSAPPLFRDDGHRLDAVPKLAHQSEERFH